MVSLQFLQNDEAVIRVKMYGGLNRIKQLQFHANEQIYLKTLDIIEKFFADGYQLCEERLGCSLGRVIIFTFHS